MTQDAKGNLFASFAHGISKVSPDDGIVTIVVKSDAWSAPLYAINTGELLLIDNTTLVIVNRVHPSLALYDLSTKTTSSICTGKLLDKDGSLGNCKLSQPSSLVVIRDELYVGDKKQIVKDACKYHL